LVDQLCSFPDLLSNALQGDLPFSLSHRSYCASLAAHLQLFITSQGEVAAARGAASSTASFAHLAPLSSVLAKLVRLGHTEMALDALLEPLFQHCLSLLPDTPLAEPDAAASPLERSHPSTLSSHLLSAHAAVFQRVGVQAQENLLGGMLCWVGARFEQISMQIVQHPDAQTAAALHRMRRALACILPSLFPLDFFLSSPFFSLLTTHRFFFDTSAAVRATRVDRVRVESERDASSRHARERGTGHRADTQYAARSGVVTCAAGVERIFWRGFWCGSDFDAVACRRRGRAVG